MLNPLLMNSCYHCGYPIYHPVCFHSKSFCCQGCKTVYELFTAHGLTNYYQLEKKPGLKPTRGPYPYLKKESIVNQLLEFKETELHIILLSLPAIHCSSCIWILEKLPQLHSGILRATVNFQKNNCVSATIPKKPLCFDWLNSWLPSGMPRPFPWMRWPLCPKNKIDVCYIN